MVQRISAVAVMTLALGWPITAEVMAADSPCQEAQEILGLSLKPAVAQEAESARGLVITEVAPFSQGANIGLQAGDIIQQINSWQARDCEGYRRTVRDARKGQKALLMLVTRGGQRQLLSFEPEMWQRQEEKQEAKEAVVALQTMLAVPLPPKVQDQVEQTGPQALAALREVAAVAVLRGRPNAYEQGVVKAQAQLAALDQEGQGDAEKRITAAAKVVLDYYLTAQEIRQYKRNAINKSRNDQLEDPKPLLASTEVPYLLDSPVPGWLDKYPFLRESVSETPRTVSIGGFPGEWPGRWNPDTAVQLLWKKANEETETFARWLGGKASDQQSTASN
ncbi:MAG: PDZ domain-containing protein [Candidatus Binatia bacterium]